MDTLTLLTLATVADDGSAEVTPAPSPFADCKGCGTSRTGPFCGACGQSVDDEQRLTLRGMAMTFVRRLTGMDRGLLFTMATLYRRGPGHVAHRFVAGERRRFTHPLLLVILAAAFVLFTFRFYEDSYIVLMEAVFEQQVATMDPGAAERMAEDIGGPREMAAKMVAFMKSNMTLLVLLNAFPMGLLMRFFFRGDGTTLAEWTVLGFYITAGVNFISALYNIWLFGSSDGTLSSWWFLPIVALYSGFVMWGVKRFGDRSWGDAFVGLLAFLMSYVIAISLGALIGIVFVVARLLMAQ